MNCLIVFNFNRATDCMMGVNPHRLNVDMYFYLNIYGLVMIMLALVLQMLPIQMGG